MKNIFRILLSLILISPVAISSCKKDSSSTTGVEQIVTTGTWRITTYTETNEDKTSDFAGYTFTFNSNGQLIASLSGANTIGSWGWDDSNRKFHISIGSSKPLSDLTDDWVVLEQTESMLRLKNDNAAKNELLSFTRN